MLVFMLVFIFIYMASVILTMILCHIVNGIQPIVDTVLRLDSTNSQVLYDIEITESSLIPLFNILISVIMLVILFVDFLMLLFSPHKIYKYIKQVKKQDQIVRSIRVSTYLGLSLWKLDIIARYRRDGAFYKLGIDLVENPTNRKPIL